MHKFILLIFIFLCLGCIPEKEELYGRYYNIEDADAIHYVDLKPDGTLFHYYKKDTIERSHSGTWFGPEPDNTIHTSSWEAYSEGLLKAYSGFNTQFGDTIGNNIYWIDLPYLDITPDGSGYSDFIKEEAVAEEAADRKRRAERDKAYWEDKDTLYYPSGVIKEIGKLNGDKKAGRWTFFHETGEVEAEGVMVDNHKSFLWKYYYKNGSLKKLGTYEDGSKVGPWEYYHENGELKEAGVYIYIYNGISYDTKKRGVWEIYNSLGNLTETKKYSSREKYYDSFFMASPFDYTREQAIRERDKLINEMDQYYLEYKASLKDTMH